MIDRSRVALLQAQAEDLSRFRILIEAQFAVLMMEDSALLDPLGREADNLVAEIVRRDAELAQWAGAPGEPPVPASLQALVTSASERAGLAVLRLATRMRSLHLEQARELNAVEVEWNRLASGYAARPGAPPAPVLVDRTG